jgi:hypothetical protein
MPQIPLRIDVYLCAKPNLIATLQLDLDVFILAKWYPYMIGKPFTIPAHILDQHVTDRMPRLILSFTESQECCRECEPLAHETH